MGIRNYKYLWKLVLLMTLVGAFPVVFLGGLSFYKSSSIVRDNVTQSNRQI
mgnify:CR=1 FL=1